MPNSTISSTELGKLPDRPDIVYGSTKQWTRISSTTFRQWKADSHCNLDHGYDLEFEATFESRALDHRNWVVDFGSLKSFKGWLEMMFDHTSLVAEDDPQIEWFRKAHELKIKDLRVVVSTGCEATARLCWEVMESWLRDNGYAPRVRLAKFEVREHGGNSAYVRLNANYHSDNMSMSNV
jgi:6-pyruvoyltetrahydropterin/6-carboxytetrahydropterin synthase